MKKSYYSKILSILCLLIVWSMCTVVYGVEEKENIESKEKMLSIGDYVRFGNYYDEPIIWQAVHESEEGNWLLVAKDILTFKAFDAVEDVSADYRNWGSNYWETSNLRRWLNSEAYSVDFGTRNDANKTPYNRPDSIHVKDGLNPYDKEPGFLTHFSTQEKELIAETMNRTIIDGANISIATGGDEVHQYIQEQDEAIANGSNAKYIETSDKVFILDLIEWSYYVLNNGLEDKKFPTLKAIELCSEELKKNLNPLEEACYWFRTPRVTESNVLNDGASVRIKFYGNLILNQDAYDSSVGVVPALYLRNTAKVLDGNGKVDKPYTVR